MSKSLKWRLAIGFFIFVAVFIAVLSWKTKQPTSQDSLDLVSARINQLGYVGWQLIKCADEDVCPEDYDPQSALGLMPFVKLAEDQAFELLKTSSAAASTLAPVLRGVQECQKFCSCDVWKRYLESHHDGSFNMDLSNGADPQCVNWSDLPEAERNEAVDTLQSVEALQN